MFNLFRVPDSLQTIGLEYGNLLTKSISQKVSNDLGTIYIIMCIVLLALGEAGFLTGTEPHMEFLGALTTKTFLKVFSDAVGIDEMAVHTTGHITGCHTIEAVGIVERITFNKVFRIAEDSVTQLLIVSHLWRHNEEIATSHWIHQYRDATFLSRLTDIASQVIVKRRAWIGMTGRLCLFIVMAKLNEYVIARLNLLQNLIPTTLIKEALRGTAIHSVVINYDEIGIEALLEHHTPATLHLSTSSVLISCGRIAYYEDGGVLVGGSSYEAADDTDDTN